MSPLESDTRKDAGLQRERAEWWRGKARGLMAHNARLLDRLDRYQAALEFIAEPRCEHAPGLLCAHDIARKALAGEPWITPGATAKEGE